MKSYRIVERLDVLKHAQPSLLQVGKRMVLGPTKVFELLVATEKIDQPTVEQMRSWPPWGFSVDNSVYSSPRDTADLERLAEYMMRCPFSLARVVRLTDGGSVPYRAEQEHCRRFPGPASASHRLLLVRILLFRVAKGAFSLIFKDSWHLRGEST